MNFFNRSKARSPVEGVRVLRDYLGRLDAPGSSESKKKVSKGAIGNAVGGGDRRRTRQRRERCAKRREH
jgi:hypothetical protein